MGRGAKKGERRGGRKKGTPNKITVGAKAAIEAAFDGIGGVPALVKWSEANRSLFYSKIWIKILPTEIKNADGETFRMQIVEELTDAPEVKT